MKNFKSVSDMHRDIDPGQESVPAVVPIQAVGRQTEDGRWQPVLRSPFSGDLWAGNETCDTSDQASNAAQSRYLDALRRILAA